MSTDDVRVTLQNEAQLLTEVIKFIEDADSKGFTNQAVFIKNSWARFLGERRDAAASLANADDKDLQQDLLNEYAQVKAYVNMTRGTSDYTEDWETFLKCEAEILEHLIRRCDPT